MNHLKFTLNKTLFFLLFIGVFSFSINAQEKTKEQKKQEEFKEYLEYLVKLEMSRMDAKKSFNTSSELVKPKGVNPFVSMGTDAGNSRSWRAYMKAKAKIMNAQKTKQKKSKIYTEKELPGESRNNTRENAEQIQGFTNKSNQNTIIIEGTLGNQISDDDAIVTEAAEEDNSFVENATSIAFTEESKVFKIESELQDLEKNGELSGDLDVYSIFLEEGETVLTRVQHEVVDGAIFNPWVLVFDSGFELIDAYAGDASGQPYSGLFTSEKEDTFYFTLLDLQTIFRTPGFFDGLDISQPDVIHEQGINGSYEVVFADVNVEVDTYQIPLKKGDVFGFASIVENPPLIENDFNFNSSLFKPNDSLGISSPFYAIFPVDESPLPTVGSVGFHYVAPEDGTYVLSFEGLGEYSGEVAASRPGTESGRRQYIYLDFTGDTEFTLKPFEDVLPSSTDFDLVRNMSPLSAFLTAWDIDSTRANTVDLARKITNVVVENLEEDLRNSGINTNFDVRIISDFGIERLGERLPQVLEDAGIPYSRVIVGGTIEESGVNTVGIANSIDVGNYDVENEALVLLDILSAPRTIGPLFGFGSINDIDTADGVEKIDMVAEIVGNITSHEAGHYLGNFHTQPRNSVFSVMDSGNTLVFGYAGLEQGEIFGQDNVDVDFVKDAYTSEESFVGLDETDVNTAFALSTGRGNKVNDAIGDNEIALLEAQALNELYDILPGNMISYPVPAKIDEISTLTVTPDLSGYANISLYDVNGRKISEVFEGNLNAGKLQEIAIDFQKINLKSGFYFYKMISKSGEKTHAIIVE